MQTILPLDAPAPVHHPLQERLQEKLRAGFLVVEPCNPVLRVLPEERLEGGEQTGDVETAARIDVPGHLLHQPRLRRASELARHRFRVDGVGDTQRIIARDQSQVAHVLDVTSREPAPRAGRSAPAPRHVSGQKRPLF